MDSERDLQSLSGWGRVPVVDAAGVYPDARAEAAAFPGALPRGLGRSYGDASLPAPGVPFLDTRFLDRFISFDPATGILEAESGMSLRTVLQAFMPRGWFLPVVPGTQWVTLGGAVASNVHGKNHHRSGSIERFVTGLEVATPSGLLRCGPAENAALFRATVGGYGLTGLITRVSLRMKPIVSPDMDTLELPCRNLLELFEGFRRHDATHEYSVAWIDTLAHGASMGRGVLLLGNHARSPATPDTGKTGSGSRHKLFDVPFSLPSGVLRPWVMRLMNGAYYHLPRPGREFSKHYEKFFFPLDAVGSSNRLYGARGFYQYQCVIPDPHGEEGVNACLRFLSDQGIGSFLAVLKRCGEDTVALPFCKRGFTLALDIPNRGAETLVRLEELDRIVLKYGGRVYLTKDARLTAASFRAMYPEWREWMDVVKRYNPAGAGRSLLSERLGLWEA